VSTKKIIAVALAVLLGAIALGWAIWAMNVATSGIRGQGNAVIQKNSAQNWTKAQGEFESIYAEIVATDQKITVARQRLADDPDDRTAKDIAYGTENVCLSLVADYNAKARTYLAADFRAVDLPDQISNLDPTTDCKG